MICKKAAEMHAEDLEKRRLTVYMSCNSQYGAPYRIDLLEQNRVRFNQCLFNFTRVNMFVIFNQILKYFSQSHDRNVTSVFLTVSNSMSEIFNTRNPEKIRPYIKLVELLKYDADMNHETLDKIYEHFWRFFRRFRYYKDTATTTTLMEAKHI